MPKLYIIAGPNGAGKTTFAKEFLPHYAQCSNFVNADLIAMGIAPFSPAAASIKAGKLLLNEIDRFMSHRDDFAFETTLAGKTYIKLIEEAKSKGYSVHIFFYGYQVCSLLKNGLSNGLNKAGIMFRMRM